MKKHTEQSIQEASPHLTHEEVKQRLTELETASGQERSDLMTELAWRPAWAIRSRSGVLSLFKHWLKTRRSRSKP